MEEGRVTDSLGRVVDFRNTVVVMTSNVGAATAGEAGSLGFETGVSSDEAYAHRATKAAYQTAMSDQFRPEFLNRLDDIIVFRPLEREDLRQVVRLEFAKVAKRVLEQGISLQLTDGAVDWLLKEGYNPKFGARPIRRTIESSIEDHLSEALLKGEFGAGTVLAVDVETDPPARPDEKPKGRLIFRRTDGGDPLPTPEVAKQA